MRMFSIKNAEFYNEFYNKLNDYVNYVYQVINSSLLNDTDHFYHQFFNEEELALNYKQSPFSKFDRIFSINK